MNTKTKQYFSIWFLSFLNLLILWEILNNFLSAIIILISIFIIIHYKLIIKKIHILSSLLVLNSIFIFKLNLSLYDILATSTKFYNEDMDVKISIFQYIQLWIETRIIFETAPLLNLFFVIIFLILIDIALIYFIKKSHKKALN